MSLFKGIRFLGILVGWLVDEGLTNCGIIMMLFLLAILKEASRDYGIPYNEQLLWDLYFFFIGNGCTVVGAFVTGCIAKSHRVKNGFALWVFEYIEGTIESFYYTDQSVDSLWFRALQLIAEISSACLGAWIAKLIFGPGKAK